MRASLLNYALSLALAPFLLGVINRTKAVFAGRNGAPLLQAYFDVFKLLRKSAVYGKTGGFVFRLAPPAALAAVLLALATLPLGRAGALISFDGDLVMFAYLLGLGRFLTIIAAMDTGSSFEGMGASREAQFSAIAEPALFIALAFLAQLTGGLSLSVIYANLGPAAWGVSGAALLLCAAAIFAVYLAENSRIPFDDPNTHLELTMIHEVMVLDNSGPDFAFITFGASVKLLAFGSLIAGLLPVSGAALVDAAGFYGALLALAVLTGVVESVMARLKLLRVPQLLLGAAFLSALAFIMGAAK